MSFCAHGNQGSCEECMKDIPACPEAGLAPASVNIGTIGAIRPGASAALAAMVAQIQHAEREARLDLLASKFCDSLSITSGERDSIMKLSRLIRYGAKFVDIKVRKDGQEYEFEADWLRQIFNPVKQSLPTQERG